MTRKEIIPSVRLHFGARPAARLSLTAVLLVVVVLTGCVKRELELRPQVTEGAVEIAFAWNEQEHPQTTCILFYDQQGELTKEVVGQSDGFKGVLPVGKYHVIVHNTDARQVDFRGMERYQTAEVFALETEYSYVMPFVGGRGAVTRDHSGIPCILEPQFVYGTGACDGSELIEVKAEQTSRYTITPELLVREAEFHFVIRGDVAVQSLTGVLGGVSPGIFLAGKEHNTASCAVEFTAERMQKVAADDYYVKLNVFNLLTTTESIEGVNTMDIVVKTDDNNTLRSTIDLTATIQQIIADNEGVIPIEIPVEVEIELKAIGGLTITVRPWEDGTGGGDFE